MTSPSTLRDERPVPTRARSHAETVRPAFGELLTHWVAVGERRLRAERPDLGGVLAPEAEAGLRAMLLEDLSFAAGPTLFDLFQDWPRRRRFSRASRADYAGFVDDRLSAGAGAMFASVPTLGPLLDAVVDRWCDRASRLVDRVRSDRVLLGDRFRLEAPVDRLDRLFGGSVALTGAAGGRVVYKDRPLGMDQAFGDLLRWVNARGWDPELHVPDVMDRGDYGWMNEVPHRPPRTDIDRARYWRRTGMLLCLTHALGGGDLHAGNVHPFGGHPVVLDAEVLLRPRRAGRIGATPSALSTGWLPTPAHVGLCGIACERFVRPSLWLDAGTDAVRPRPLTPFRHELQRALADLLRHDGDAAAAGIADGFFHTYRHLLTVPLPLDVFEEARPRVLLRSTSHYVTAIADSIEPAVLAVAGLRATVVAESVAAPPEALDAGTTTATTVRRAEEAALARLDVPRFTMPATGGPLVADGRRLGAPFGEAPIARARRLLSKMSLSALEDQRRAIVEAITAAAARSDPSPATVIAARRSIHRSRPDDPSTPRHH